jgi:predicted permease
MSEVLRELRYATRSLRKSPGFVLSAILILALGIGANTAIFSVLQGAVLAPLSYPDPDRLVLVLLYNRTLKFVSYLSYPDFQDWQQSSRSFQNIAVFRRQGFDLASPGEPQHVNGLEVSSGFFGTLRTTMAIGRDFLPYEDRVGGPPAVVISDGLWRDRFSAAPAVLGRPLTLNGVGYTVVGVLQPGFRFGNPQADVYTPIGRIDSLYRNDRTVHDLASVARLRPDISLGQARAEMNALQDNIDAANPATERGLGVHVAPLKEYVTGDIAATLSLLLGAVALVLLIACANVANLVLARSAARRRDAAIRLSLGATRAQIVRQSIVESVLLSLAGGILGVAVSTLGVNITIAAVRTIVPRADNIGVNAPVLLFAFVVSIATGIIFGLMPALKSSHLDLHSELKAGGRGLAGGHQRVQRCLATVQIGLALILVTGGSLLFRTIHNLLAVKPGFDVQHVITFQIGLSSSASTSSRVRITYQRVVERLRQIPGVVAADLTALVPLGQGANEGPFWIGSHQPASMSEIPRGIYYPVGPDYFRTMEIPLLRGRSLSRTDDLNSELVAVIDSLLARRYFGGQDALDRIITVPHWGAKRSLAFRVVGVVAHVKHYGLDNSVAEKPQIYYSFYQLPDDAVPLFRDEVAFAVRTSAGTGAVLPAIRRAVLEVASDQPVYNVATMRELFFGSMSRQRFLMILLTSFAGLALVLACVGVYGVISYSAARRVHEIGIRMALGAAKRTILRMVIVEGLRIALIGIGSGLVTVLLLARGYPASHSCCMGFVCWIRRRSQVQPSSLLPPLSRPAIFLRAEQPGWIR